MSSATSTKAQVAPVRVKASSEGSPNTFRASHFFILASLMAATGAVIVFVAYVAGSTIDVLRDRGRSAALRALGTALGAQVLGLALAAVVLLPTLAHIGQSVRALAMTPELFARQ